MLKLLAGAWRPEKTRNFAVNTWIDILKHWTMRAKTLLLLACAAPLTAFAQTAQRGTIDFELEELKADTLFIGTYLASEIDQRNLRLDTIAPGRDKYAYTAETDTTAYNVFVASEEDLSKTIFFALLPGDHFRVTGSLRDWQVEGSELNAAYAPIQKACRPYQERMDSLRRAMTEDVYNNEFMPTWHRMDSLQAAYVRRHPDSDLSLFILSHIDDEERVRELYPTLTERVKRGPFASIARMFEEGFRKERIFEENKKRIAEGAQAPDFTLNDLRGKPLALSSLRGKYVVLDFWGSWCGWCIHGIPDMKKYYAKYKDRMEILGIDCRDKEEAWKAAVEKHALPWLHVRNEGNPDVSLLYAVEGYPTKIVVDPEGKIAKIVVGESPEFYQYLDQLFQ